MKSIKDHIASLLQKVSATMHLDDRAKFRESFLKLHNHDRAKYLFKVPLKARKQYYAYLEPRELARLLESVKAKERAGHIAEMPAELAANVLAEMYVDNAIDTLKLLAHEQQARYLSAMPPAAADKIGALIHYGDETAGSIMTSELVSMSEDTTAGEALELVKKQAGKAVTVYYIYTTNEKERLVNVVSLKHILLADKDKPLSELGRDHVLSIQATADKVAAAKMLRDYNFLALPVIDFEGRLVGVITVDDVVDLIDQVAATRYSRLAAVGDVELTDDAVTSAVKRLPWLILPLFLGILTAALIGHFEEILAQVAILAAFIPIVSGTTGNSGTQSLAVMVRGIATGKLKRLSLKRYFLKESVTAFIISIACGLVLTAIVLAWKSDIYVGLVAGGALALSLFIGTLSGSLMPLVMSKLGTDPAVASGPFISTICDVISMAIYFGLATALMGMLL